MRDSQPREESRLRVRGAGAWAGLALCAVAAVTMLAPPLLGLERYVVTGGSMGGTIARGSIVYERAVPVSRLRVGDVITYTPPPSSHAGGRVTHRIAWIGTDGRGARLFQTKGDANAARDPWRFTLGRPTQPRVVFHVRLLGYLFAALSVRAVRLAVIGIPALLIAASALAGLWRRAPGEAPA